MATLVIGAAINIAVGLALNALFPPPDVNQEGPRLSELGYTSAAFGKFVNIVFGTDRVDGNIIDVQDPVIEERVSVESQSGGKGGGQSVSTTTYSYFWTGRIAFAIEGAADIIQLYGDGKLIYDATGTTQLIREGVAMRFDPGGRAQIQDSEEVGRAGRSAAAQPAYRHLTTVKIDQMPLADFGNRIPNFTAVIAFNSNSNIPHLFMTEQAGLDVPGSLTGADTSYMSFDPTRNLLASLKTGSDSTWTANAATMELLNLVGSGGFSQPTLGLDGFVWCQDGAANAGPLQKRDVDTGQVLATLGSSGLGLVDSLTGPTFGNTGLWYQLQTQIPGVGEFSTVFHLNTSFPAGGPPNGAVVDGDNMSAYHLISTADGLVNDGGPLTGKGIPDHVNGRFFILQDDSLNNKYNLVMYQPNFEIGIGGATQTSVTASLLRAFTRGSISAGDDFTGTGEPAGWAVNTTTGDLMLSNGSSTILYNPDTDQILAQLDGNSSGFKGQNNYYSGSIFAWMNGSSTPSASSLTIVDTRTLEVIRSETDIGTLMGFGDSVIHDESQVWDDRVSAIYLSRVEVGSTAVTDERVVKVFVNRVDGLGVSLSSVVEALCTSYNNIEMAALEAGDYDVSTLTGETVQGYTINRRSGIKSALKPLRDRFQFDVIQSDWGIKFPTRGGAAVTTIPEEFVGQLRRGRSQTDDPPIQEVRTQDVELPMRLNIRYRNKDISYDTDIDHAKRHRLPSSTMNSKSEKTLDLPIVDTAGSMKPLAEEWLWTMWNERRQLKTVIPWDYLELDPTDIVNIGAFNGDTLRVRLSEQDVGAGLAMDIVGITENEFTFSSTIGAGTALGRPTTNVPSSLPTRLILADAPLLHVDDLLLTPISNAYIAAGGYESTWAGATVYKSIDDVDYTQTTTANVEAAMAKITVAPPAMGFGNGNATNRIIRSDEGGTMTIVPLTRGDVWATATEEAMLNGANTIMIVYANGTVQIMQFINVTDNGDNTFTLTDLLLGRLGTEDIAATAPSVGDVVVLLSNNTGTIEDTAVQRQRLAVAELDTVQFYKGVSIGTLLEDANAQSYTYTGRDLKPYTVADIRGVSDGSGGLDISWQHRTRGPGQGEWLDLVGSVPLNEVIEEYVVSLENAGGVFISKTVTTNSVNFTLAEIESGGVSGGVAKQFWPATNIVAGDQEGGTTATDAPITEGGWTNINSPTGWFYRPSAGIITGPPVDARISPASTDFMYHQAVGSDPQRTVRNVISLIDDLGMEGANIPLSTALVNVWCAQTRSNDSFDIWLHVMDQDENILGTVSHLGFQADTSDSGVALGQWISVGSIYSADSDPWPQRNLEISLDLTGAAKLAIDFGQNKGGTTFSSGATAFDHLEIQIVTPAPDITVNIVQNSDSGKSSPTASRQVT